ncbi:MAG TPA: CbiX/SirB N-terminal domain-containing protein [Usitatibacter sp.]|nr:CbiX/SirB N-terminal domain-containing protein [Usitatibacter sp.]
MRGIVLFAHGARDPEWAAPFQQVRARLTASRPECRVELAFLELMSPTLEESIARLVEQGALAVTVFPLFMAQGGHLKQDLPRILDDVRARHPRIPIALEKPIGEVPEILDAIAAWIAGRSG